MTKKKKYNVYGTVTGGAYLGQIEASTAEEAQQIAEEGKVLSLYVSFCHQCAKYCENAEITEMTVEEA
jgi:hypothetical protein